MDESEWFHVSYDREELGAEAATRDCRRKMRVLEHLIEEGVCTSGMI